MGPHSPPGWATHLPGTSPSRPRAKAILPGLCVPRAPSTGHGGTPSLGGALGSDTFCKTQGDRGVSSAGPVGLGRPEVQNFTWRRRTARKAPRHPGAALARPKTHPDCRVPHGCAHPRVCRRRGPASDPHPLWGTICGPCHPEPGSCSLEGQAESCENRLPGLGATQSPR